MKYIFANVSMPMGGVDRSLLLSSWPCLPDYGQAVVLRLSKSCSEFRRHPGHEVTNFPDVFKHGKGEGCVFDRFALLLRNCD